MKRPTTSARDRTLVVASIIALACSGVEHLPGKPITVSSVSPTSGPTSGGTTVTVRGSGFPQNIESVTFGAVPAPTFTVFSDTLATVVTPPHAAGTVDVTAKLTTGESATAPGTFTYIAPPPPALTDITPTSGPSVGGTAFTIHGTDIASGAAVSFGGTAATGISVAGTTTITGVTPVHAAATVDVIATNADGKGDTLTSAFTFTPPVIPPPVITSISPTHGSTAGAVPFTIQGSALQAGATVAFGGVGANSVNVSGSTTITGNSPSHAAGAVDVVVTNPDAKGDTLVAGYTYQAPASQTIVAVSRSAGSAAGGAQVVITGTNFVAGATVEFGIAAASNVQVNSPTSITATVPAHATGIVDVSVTQSGSAATLSNAFAYLPAPTVTYFSSTFEDGTLGSLVPDPASGGSAAVSTDFAFAGTHSAKSTQTSTAGGGAALTYQFNNPANPAFSNANGVYLRWYLYVPTATVDLVQASSPFTAQIKLHLMRLTTGSGQPGWVMCGVGQDFPPGRVLTCFVDNNILFIPGGTTNHQLGDGVWLELQLWYKRANGMGQARMWVNGVQIFDVTDGGMGNEIPTNPYKAYFGAVYVESPNGTINVYIDNVAAADGYIDP